MDNSQTRSFISDKSTFTKVGLYRSEAPIRMQVLTSSATTSSAIKSPSPFRVVFGSSHVPSWKPSHVFSINFLGGQQLRRPLSAIVEPDGNSFIARTPDLPLYGLGDDPISAIEALNNEIASLYEDLQQDDNFTDEWLKIKKFFLENLQ